MKAAHHPKIATGRAFRESLRAGPYAWPGGYPLAFICEDGEALCFACAKENARLILSSIRAKSRDGWRVVGLELLEEPSADYCAQCYGFFFKEENDA